MAELEQSFRRGRFAAIAESIRRSLYKDQVEEQVVEVKTKKPEPLALTPIAKPTDGPVKLLYHIAYDPGNETHPLHDASEALLVKGGVLSSHDAATIETPTNDITHMMETRPNGNLVSDSIVIAYGVQSQMHDVFTAAPPSRIPAENLNLKAMRLSSSSAD